MHKKNVWAIILILISISVAGSLISLLEMYRIAVSKEDLRLRQMLAAYVTLAEAVARFDEQHSELDFQGGASAATLSQIIDGLSHLKGFGKTGEFVLGKKTGGQIVFMYTDRQDKWGLPEPVAFRTAKRAEPMRQALSGKTGSMTGFDYRQEMVLAAYAPIKGLGFGLVAKMDLAEIRNPFIRTAFISFCLLSVLVAAGAFLVIRITNPIIERYQMQSSKIEERELRTRAIIDTAVDGIITINTDGIIESFNPAAEKIFGYASTEVIGRKVNMLQPSPINQEHDEYIQRYIKTREKKIIGVGRKIEGKHKNGKLIPLHLSVSEVNLNDRTLFTGILRDISFEKKAEIEFQALADRLQLATKSANVGIWDWNIKKNRLVWDDQMYNLYGITSNEFEGAYQAWQKGVHPEDLSASEQAVQAALQGEKDFDTEFRVVWPNGEIRNIKAYALVQRDVSGKPLHMVGVNWDITDQIDSERKLRRAKEQAEGADRLKSAFLASMSHEIRTPLNSIIGFTGILLQEIVGTLNPEQKKQLSMVQNSSEHLLNLINDILDLSKIESGQLAVENSPFDYHESVAMVVKTLTPFAEKKGLRLIVDEIPTGRYLVGDCRRVEQVLINIVNNAIKFTDAGSVSIGFRVRKDMLSTIIKDTGIGIAAKDIGHIFDKFRQVETTLSKKYEGTGLGLAISKSLITLMGGNIMAQSHGLDKGSTFTFTLPAAAKED